MKARKFFLAFFLFISGVFHLSGISFSDLDLSSDNRLLFKAEFEGQQAVFISQLDDLSLQQITAFPERLELIENGRTILAHGKFGTLKIPSSGGLPSGIPGFPSFSAGYTPLKGRTPSCAVSPDGRWTIYVEPVSPAYGKLFLAEIASGEKRIISEKIELPAADFPACWSPDSRLFVYSKEGRLFYFPIIRDFAAAADERFRLIGSGEISSILWGQQGDFFYFSRNTLYRVLKQELFTRTIYGDFLSIGTVTAAFPFDFIPGFDRYWISPDSGSILINKNGKSIFFFMLGENRQTNVVLPHITLPQADVNLNVLWSVSGQVTVISSLSKKTAVWRFEINGKNIKTVIPANNPSFINGALSPDGTKVIFWGESGLELWDYVNWRLIQKLSGDYIYSCVWINNMEIAAGNSRFTEAINVSGMNFTRRVICLSSVSEIGFEDGSRSSSRILAKNGNEWFATNGRSSWVQITNVKLPEKSIASGRYRVYLEDQTSGHYKNILMIRNLASTGTISLVSKHSAAGSYSRQQQKIALCFDLYDDDTGLSQVLNALRLFNIKATFFMNGDFIRRNPLAAAAIAEAGHETASLFYAPIDLSDSRYRVNPEFISQGLARNEDEFFQATGKELALLWHPPYYRSSAMINSAASGSGYITAFRDVDPGDWLTRDEALRLNIRQQSASYIIEQIINTRKMNAVIPVRLGLLPGGRDEYLYQRIEVLLDSLIRCGFEIVLVSAVVN
jgi:peptidoglycan/xylan/chitin deacetylase (PgdA/CDA1 family)